MRALLFVVAFVVALLATAPLDRWVLPRLRAPLARAGLELEVDGIGLALPAGIRATGLRVEGRGGSLALEGLYLGLPGRIAADGCGGRVDGSFTTSRVDLDLHSIDPSRCLRAGQVEVEAALDGHVRVEGLDPGAASPAEGASLQVRLASAGGIFRGSVPGAGFDGTDLPLGEWEFRDLALDADVASGRVEVREGRASVGGVEFELRSATLPSGSSREALRIEFRVKELEDSSKARALVGMLPKAAPDAGGWRNYRVTGTLRAPRVVAADRAPDKAAN